MNTKGIVLSGIAIFAGVFGALQADRLLNHQTADPAAALPDLLPIQAPSTVIPTSMDTNNDSMLDFRAAAKKVVPSVVSVDRYERVQRDLFDQTGQIAETGTGSGVIVSSSGIIVTNNHVVADASGQAVPEVKVHLSDKRTFKAKVLGTDPRADLAVIQIDAPNLVPAELGNSGGLEVGQWVMAVGNPLGFNDTVSVGVVSSLKRDLPVGASGISDAIQTDAAINPGNSGGALCDQHGRLIGINSAIASTTRASIGIGFAIPIDRAKLVVNDIVKYGHARYAGLGVLSNPNWEGALADPDTRQQLAEVTNSESVPAHGVILAGSSGAAANAGLGKYDVLLSIDGTPTDSYFDMNKILMAKKPGQKVQVKWWTKGQTKSATVTLQEIGGPVQ